MSHLNNILKNISKLINTLKNFLFWFFGEICIFYKSRKELQDISKLETFQITIFDVSRTFWESLDLKNAAATLKQSPKWACPKFGSQPKSATARKRYRKSQERSGIN